MNPKRHFLISTLIFSILSSFSLVISIPSAHAAWVSCGAGPSAFYTVTSGVASDGNGCTGVLTLDESVTSIAADAFYITQITQLIIPDSVTSIGANAFYAAEELTTVIIGNEVTTIGESAFYAAEELTTVTLGNKVATIGVGAFSASALTSLTLPASLTSLGLSAFYAPAFAITDYEYSLNGGAYTSAGTTTSPFTITGLSGRTTYSVTIKARNSAGLSTASSSLSATTTDASLDANEAAAAAEAARVAAANAEAARKAKEQKELTEILAIIPKIGELTLGLGETTKSLYSNKCVKGKTTKFVKKGAKCPKGYVKKK